MKIGYTGPEVWFWPEFIAFANRLGIDRTKQTKRLVITMDTEDAVAIDQQYLPKGDNCMTQQNPKRSNNS